MDGTLKLGDFGLARKVKNGELSKTFCGSSDYAAPELFRQVMLDKLTKVRWLTHTVWVWVILTVWVLSCASLRYTYGLMSTCRAFKEGIRSLSCWYLVMWNCFIRYVIGRGWFPDRQSPAIRPVINLALSNHEKLPFDNNSQRQMIRSTSVDGKCSQIVLRSR